MPLYSRFAVMLTIAGIATAGLSASAFAADAPFGQHLSMCAQVDLGQRAGAPQVTCTHDGMTMTFATFGAMVQYMCDTES